jgi:opacity protein-like surface antigen
MHRTSKISLFVAVALLAISTSAYALSGLGLGVKAGVLTSYKNPNLKLSTYKMDDLKFYGAFVKFGAQGITLEAGVETFWNKKKLDLQGPGLLINKIEVKARDILLTATAKFYFKFPIINPFVGAGIGAHKFTYSYTGDLGGYSGVEIKIPDDKTYLGYHLVVGAKTAIAVLPFDLFVEGKIGRVNSSGDPTDFTILSGGVIINLP